jgi:hypothetical protein
LFWKFRVKYGTITLFLFLKTKGEGDNLMDKAKIGAKVIIIGLIFLVGGLVNANPNADSYYESVEELLLLMKVDENLAYTFAQLRPILLEQFQAMMDGDVTSEQVQIMEKYMGEMLDMMEEEMSWEKIKDDFIHVYMSVYTEEEIQELIKFYQTPVGQKTIEQTPILMEQSMEISQKYLFATLPKLQSIAEKMEAELKATDNE